MSSCFDFTEQLVSLLGRNLLKCFFSSRIVMFILHMILFYEF